MLILGIALVSGCIQPQSSFDIMACPGIYVLNHSVGFSVSTDAQAFDILKEGWTYDNQNNNVWVEDRISSDMTSAEALQKGLLKSNQDITLESGEIVNGVWMLTYRDKAVDAEGNLYFCKY